MGEYGEYCLLLRGSVFCDQLRFGAPLAKGPPVGGFDDVRQIQLAAGLRCVLRRDGSVYCAGSNANGQLGAGLHQLESRSWARVLDLGPVESIALSPYTVCAAQRDGRVLCWGDNGLGQTGSNRSYAAEASELVRPHEILEARGARALSLTHTNTCALSASGELLCWGEPHDPTLTSDPSSRRPTWLRDLGRFDRLATSSLGRCGVRQGALYCFGSIAFLEPDALEAAVAGLPAVQDVAMAESHACVLGRDGSVWCLGQGRYGVLGYDVGDTWDRQAPRRVDGVPPARSVLTSSFVTCAITRADEVYCWGGQLDGAEPVTHPPTRIALE